MFDSLKTIAMETIQAPVVEITGTETTAQEGVSFYSEDTADLLIDNCADITPQHAEYVAQMGTRTELKALIASIEQFGLAPALAAFANHDGNLGSAVPQFPALEALSSEFVAANQDEILTSLKEIDASFDVVAESDDEEAAQEFLLIAGAAIFGIVYVALASIPVIAMWKGFRHWSTTKEDREARLVRLVPFAEVKAYVEAAMALPKVAHEIASMSLPKTEEEAASFVAKLKSEAAPLKAFGMEWNDKGHFDITPMPKPVKQNIEHAGYHEGSLAELAGMAETAKSVLEELKHINFDHHEQQYRAMDKADRKAALKVVDGAADVLHLGSVRAAKVLQLLKMTCKTLKPFYKD